MALDGSAYMRRVYATNLTRGDAPGLEQGWNAMLTTYVRFALWDDVLNDTGVVPPGAPPTPYASVLRHYSRGLAFLHARHAESTSRSTRQGRIGEAAGEAAAGEAAAGEAQGEIDGEANNGKAGGSRGSRLRIRSSADPSAATEELNRLRAAMQLIITRAATQPAGFSGMAVHLARAANATLSAGILLAEGNGNNDDDDDDKYTSTSTSAIDNNVDNFDAAVALLEGAVDSQDRFHYDEPPDWHISVLQCLGQVLLDGGRVGAAVDAFSKDLKAYPENGWGLTGLLQSMLARGTSSAKEITAVRNRLSKSWAHADVPLPSAACPALALRARTFRTEGTAAGKAATGKAGRREGTAGMVGTAGAVVVGTVHSPRSPRLPSLRSHSSRSHVHAPSSSSSSSSSSLDWDWGLNPRRTVEFLSGAHALSRGRSELPLKAWYSGDIRNGGNGGNSSLGHGASPLRSLPTSFDARTAWPLCDSIKDVWDQSSCGDCWAVATVTAAADRMCIATTNTTIASTEPSTLPSSSSASSASSSSASSSSSSSSSSLSSPSLRLSVEHMVRYTGLS